MAQPTAPQRPESDAPDVNPVVQRARAQLAARERQRRLPLLLGLAFVGLLTVIGAVAGVLSMLNATISADPVAVEALAVAKASPAIQDQLGVPIRTSGMWGGSVGEGGSAAQVHVTLSGERGEGELTAEGVSDAEGVRFTRLGFAPEGGAPVDLLPEAEAAAAQRQIEKRAPVLQEAQDLARRGDRDGAAAIVERLLRENPRHLEAAALRAELREASGALDLAEDDLLFILGQEPDRAPERHRLGRVQAAQGDLDACVATYTLLIQDNAGDGAAWLGRARCARDQATASGDEKQRRAAAAGAREACRLGQAEGCALSKELAP